MNTDVSDATNYVWLIIAIVAMMQCVVSFLPSTQFVSRYGTWLKPLIEQLWSCTMINSHNVSRGFTKRVFSSVFTTMASLARFLNNSVSVVLVHSVGCLFNAKTATTT